MAELRISDADREVAVHQLGEHYAEGRLTKDELDERSDAVWSARTRSDLSPLFADLPRNEATARSARRSPPLARLGRLPRPLAGILLVLVVVAVLTHLPVVLLVVGLWFVLGRCHHGSWGGHRSVRG